MNQLDEIKHLIKDYGLDNTIQMHEERISYAKTHPRNPFFKGVIEQSKRKLITLNQIKNETIKI